MKKIIVALLMVSCILVLACEANTYSEIEEPIANTNTDTGTTTGTTTNVTYTNDIQPIMTKNCTSCHRSGVQSPSLTTYTQVKNAVSNGNVLCAIQASPGCKSMPPSGKMSQANIDLILLWKTQGYIQ